MTTSDKEQVLDATADDQGIGATPSAADAAQAGRAGSSEPAAGQAAADEPAAGQPEGAEAVEAEVLDEGEASTDGPAGEASEAGEAAAEAAGSEADEMAKAKAEAADWQDKYVRLHAEWDTYRRRTNEQRAAEKARATEKLVVSLLPVIDDFERTIDYAENNGETGLLGGVQAVYAKLVDTLKKDGVEIIDPAGEAFDALEAQAVATVDDASVPDETVAQVYQKGYRMGTKVLRPAMVTVTTGGPKREKPADDEAE